MWASMGRFRCGAARLEPRATSAKRGISSDGTGNRSDSVNIGSGEAARLRASGQTDAAVPPRFQQRVGEYFRRVADELGDNQQK